MTWPDPTWWMTTKCPSGLSARCAIAGRGSFSSTPALALPHEPMNPSRSAPYSKPARLVPWASVPTSSPTWGDDVLRGTIVEAGGSLALPVAPDIYDVKAEDCDGRVLHSS